MLNALFCSLLHCIVMSINLYKSPFVFLNGKQKEQFYGRPSCDNDSGGSKGGGSSNGRAGPDWIVMVMCSVSLVAIASKLFAAHSWIYKLMKTYILYIYILNNNFLLISLCLVESSGSQYHTP